MRSLLLFVFLLAAQMLRSQDTSFSTTVYFESRRYDITPDADGQIRNLLLQAGDRKILQIIITGHTDDVGGGAANEALSQQRAMAVYGTLVSSQLVNLLSVAKDIQWKGEADPSCNNINEEGRSCNRRVTVTLVAENRASITILELYGQIDGRPQQFCFTGHNDTMLVCRNGSLVLLKAGSIDIPSGFENACIEVVVREALTRYDIITQNLSTVSDQRPMVSEAMLQLRFFSRGTELFLKKGKNFTVLSPSEGVSRASALYDSEWQPDGQVNWKNDDKKNSLMQNQPASSLANCAGGGFRNCLILEASNCANCDLFFCGIGKWMKGWFNKGKRIQARAYFACKQTERNAGRTIRNNSRTAPAPFVSDATIDSMFKIYAQRSVDLPLDSLDECGRLIARFGLQDLNLHRRILDRSIDSMVRNSNPLGITELDKLQYDIFNWQGNTWANVDWMLKVPEAQMVQVEVLMQPDAYTDCKLIFKNYRTILPGVRNVAGRFVFPFLPPGEPAWLLMVHTKTGTNKVSAELKEIKTSAITVTPALSYLSVADFASLLKGMDRKFL